MALQRKLTILFSLLGALLRVTGAQQPQVVVKLVGSDVTLVPTYSGNPSEINWKINGDKLVDMELNPRDITFYRLQDRADIVSNGALTIRNLTMGDSGNYLAEAVGADKSYQNTEIRLDVRACPAEPTISDKSTEKDIVLLCESSSPDVTYEWFKETVSISKNPSFTEPRPKETVNLTCVVANGVCQKSAFKIIAYTPESSGLSGGIVALIVILVLVLALILIPIMIALCYHFRDNARIKPIYSALTRERESHVNVFKAVHSRFCCFKGNDVRQAGVHHFNAVGNGEATPAEGQPLNPMGNDEETPAEGQPLNAVENCNSITVFQTEDGPKGSGNPRLTRHGVKYEEGGHHSIEVLQTDGEKYALPIKETASDGIILLQEDRATLAMPDEVAEMTWKEGGVPQFKWAASGLKLYTNDVTLGGGSVTVHNAEGSGGSYKVEVHSTNNHIFQLEERPESPPLGSITFHPKNLPSGAPITWKKDGQPVNTGDGRINSDPCGDLTINNVTSEDGGKYAVCSEDRQLELFTLRL